MTWLSNTRKSEKNFKDDFRLIIADLSKQKALDADPKAIQQIIFTGQVDDEALTVFYILEKSKETILEFARETTKVLQLYINGWI